MFDEPALFCKGVPPRYNGVDQCTCKGCWACEGHVMECTCDIDWECLYGRHMRICFTYDRR